MSLSEETTASPQEVVIAASEKKKQHKLKMSKGTKCVGAWFETHCGKERANVVKRVLSESKDEYDLWARKGYKGAIMSHRGDGEEV